jgi:hypothetical protein
MTTADDSTPAPDAETDALLETMEREHVRLAVDAREAAALVWAAHAPGPPAAAPAQLAAGDLPVGALCCPYEPAEVVARLRALPDGAGARAYLVALGLLPEAAGPPAT